MSATLIKHSFCPLSHCLTPLCIYIRYSFMVVSEGNREGERWPTPSALSSPLYPALDPNFTLSFTTCTHANKQAARFIRSLPVQGFYSPQCSSHIKPPFCFSLCASPVWTSGCESLLFFLCEHVQWSCLSFLTLHIMHKRHPNQSVSHHLSDVNTQIKHRPWFNYTLINS